MRKTLASLAISIPLVGFGGFLAIANGQTCEVNLTDANAAGDANNRSLKYCITNLTDGDTVTFANSISTVTFSEVIMFDKSLTIDGETANGDVTLDADGFTAFSVFDQTKTLSLSNLSIIDGLADPNASGNNVGDMTNLNDDGGAVRTKGDLVLTDVTLSGNSAPSGKAGGAYMEGDLTLIGQITLTNNTSQADAGVFWVEGVVNGTNSSITSSGNQSGDNGGVINSTGAVTLGSVSSTDDFAYLDGGFVMAKSSLTINGDVVSTGAEASEGDGGFAKVATTMTVNANVTSSGSVSRVDGGFANVADAFSITGNAESTNDRAQNGNGGFINSLVSVTIDGDFESNNSSAIGDGGSVFSGGDVSFGGDVTATDNSSFNNSGGFVYSTGNLGIGGVVQATGNTAFGDGGFAYVGGTLTHTGASFTATNNLSSSNSGGAIYALGNTSFNGPLVATGNTANTSGGFLRTSAAFTQSGGDIVATSNISTVDSGGFVSAGTVTSAGGTFSGNEAYANGGSFQANAEVTLTSAVFEENNQATVSTGGFINSGASVTLVSLESDGSSALADGGSIAAAGNVNITGAVSASATRVSANYGGVVYAGSNVTIGELFARNIDGPTSGGVIYATGNLTINGPTDLADITARNGSLWVGGSATLGSLKVRNATQTSSGGVVYATGDISLTGYLDSDQTTGGGGSVLNGAAITIAGGNIENATNNSGVGAAIGATGGFTSSGNLTLKNLYSANSGGIYAAAVEINGDFVCEDAELNSGRGNCIYVSSGNLVITGDVTVSDTSGAGCGSAFYALGSASMGSLTATDVTADCQGGVLDSTGVTINGHSEFTRVSSGQAGGAIYSSAGGTFASITATDVHATAVGGVLNIQSGQLVVTDLVTSNTSASSPGGVIYQPTGSASFDSIRVTDSSSGSVGGALDIGNDLTVSGDATFIRSTAGAPGGAVNAGGNVSFGSLTLVDVSSSSTGGAINASGDFSVGTLSATNVSSGSVGGVINASAVDIERIEVQAATGGIGGTIHAGGAVTIDGGFIRNSTNSSSGPGGAIYSSSSVTLKNLEISDAIGDYGTVYGTDVFLDGVSLLDNDATFASAVYADSDLTAINSSLSGNSDTSSSGGGLIYSWGNVEIISSTIEGTVFGSDPAVEVYGDLYLFGSIFESGDTLDDLTFPSAGFVDLGGNLFSGVIGGDLSEFSQDELTSAEFGLLEPVTDEDATVVLKLVPISESSSAVDFVSLEAIDNALAESALSSEVTTYLTGLKNLTSTDARGQLRNLGLTDSGAFEFVPTTVVSGPVFTAPVPFVGPVVTNLIDLGSNKFEVIGRNLTSVSKALLGEEEILIDNPQSDSIVFTADISEGTYPLSLEHTSGVLMTEYELIIGPINAQSSEPEFWTKQISPIEIKLYAKNIVGAGKVQFFHNGNEVAWVRAEDENEPKLRVIESGPMTGANYLVRTREMVEGKNVFEIFVDGERVLRRAQAK